MISVYPLWLAVKKTIETIQKIAQTKLLKQFLQIETENKMSKMVGTIGFSSPEMLLTASFDLQSSTFGTQSDIFSAGLLFLSYFSEKIGPLQLNDGLVTSSARYVANLFLLLSLYKESEVSAYLAGYGRKVTRYDI